DAIEAALLAGGVRGARRFAKGTMVPVHEAAPARAVMSAPAEGVETMDTPGPWSEPRRLQPGVVGHDHLGQGLMRYWKETFHWQWNMLRKSMSIWTGC
ncbi:MAG: hypothetical protein V4679_12980, partial [Pseudomonadota bacterium]